MNKVTKEVTVEQLLINVGLKEEIKETKLPSDYIKNVEDFLIHAETKEEIAELSSYIFPTPLPGTQSAPVTGSYVKATSGMIKSISKYAGMHISEVNGHGDSIIKVVNKAAMASNPKRKGFVHTIYILNAVVAEASAANKWEQMMASDETRLHPAEREFLRFKREHNTHGLTDARQKAMYITMQDMGAYKLDRWAELSGLALELCSKQKTYKGAIATGCITPYKVGRGDKERQVYMVYMPWAIKNVFDPMEKAGMITYDATMTVRLQTPAEIKKRKLNEAQMKSLNAFRKGYFFLEKELHDFTEAEWSRIVAMPKAYAPFDGTPLAIREEWRYYHVINQMVHYHTAKIASRMQMGEGYAALLAGTAANYLATRSVTAKERGLAMQPINSEKDLHNEIRTLFRSYGDASKAIDNLEMQRARAAGEAIEQSENSYADHSSSTYIPTTCERNYKVSEQDISLSYMHLATKHFVNYLNRRNKMEWRLSHNQDGSVKKTVSFGEQLDFIAYCEQYELAHFGRELRDIPVGSVLALYFRNQQRCKWVRPVKWDRTAGATVIKHQRIADLKAPAGWHESSLVRNMPMRRVHGYQRAGWTPMDVAQIMYDRGERYRYCSTAFDMRVLECMEELYSGGSLPIVHPQSVDGVVRN